MMKFAQNNFGFTLIEIILSVALVAFIAGVMVPVFQSFQNQNELNVTVLTFVGALRRAQTNSRSMVYDASWGVRISSSTITIFKGVSFSARDPAFDESMLFSGDIVATGITEVVFSKYAGLPSVVGTTTLTTSAGEINNVAFNEKGTVLY